MFRVWPLALIVATFSSTPAHAATSQVDPAKLGDPVCADAVLKFDKDKGSCEPRDDLAGKGENDCPKQVSGFAFKDGKCSFDPKLAASPTCEAGVPNLAYDAKTKRCVLVVGSPSSSPGAYVGDCFKITSEPKGRGLLRDKYYTVTHQRASGEEGRDRTLTLVDGDLNPWPFPGLFGCSAVGGETREIAASTLMEHGAKRFGWTYGALTMPYKYYPSAKSFVAGLPIGAYMGWRMGRAGSGITAAAAFTLSQVKADTVDPKTLDADGKPTVTGTTDIAALSGAVGLVYDLSKEPGTKAYKAGLFFGKDRINRSPTIDYKYDRKWWMALQLGFDFTDF